MTENHGVTLPSHKDHSCLPCQEREVLLLGLLSLPTVNVYRRERREKRERKGREKGEKEEIEIQRVRTWNELFP